MTPNQFLLIADPLPEPMVLLMGDGLILAGNRAVEERLGIDLEKLRGRKLADVVTDTPDEVAHYLRLCSRTRTMVLGRMVFQGLDGEVIACRTEGTLVCPKIESSDALLMLRLIPKEVTTKQFLALNLRVEELGREIQRRKRSEETARQQEERLRVTLASIGDAVITTDTEGRITNMNAVAESLTGWAIAEAMGQALDVVFHIVNEETRQPVENPALRALRENVIVGLANHTVLIAKDGAERPIDDSAAPIRSQEGVVFGCVLVFRDVTERRAAEADNQKIIATLESMTDGFMRLDQDWNIVYMNREFERQFQCSRAGQLGKVFWEEWPITLGTEMEVKYRRAVVEQVEVQFETYYAPFDRWFDLKATPMADGSLSVFSRDITRRKQVEEQLRLAEEQFHTLADSIPQLSWIANADGSIFWYNRRWYDYTGATLEQMEGWGWQSVHDPDELPKVLEYWKASIATGQPFDRVFPLKGKDGVFRPFLTRIEPVKNHQGQVVRWFGTNTDISEQKRVEQQLRDSEEALKQREQQLRLVTDNAPVFIAHCDAEGRFKFVNQPYAARFGLTPKDVIGKRIPEVVGKRAYTIFEPYVAEALAGNPVEFEVEIPYAVGGAQFMRAAYTPQWDDTGKIIGLVAAIVNIDERKRAEDALRESEERFRALADHIPQLTWIAEPGTDGEIHWFNQNWFQYTGTTLEEMQGTGWHAVQHPDHAQRVIQKFTQHVQEGLDWEDTFPLRGKDGEYRWFLSRMKAIHNASGRVVQLFGTNTDITQQQHMEEKLRRLTEELYKADRRKNEFLATLAHELRNPLAPIRNGLQLIRLAGGQAPTVEQARTMMERQLEQLVRLIDDLMDLSRITTGAMKLRQERAPLAEVVASALETSRPHIEEMAHELTVTLPLHPIIVNADVTRLAQVFVNLLNNAAKYSNPGSDIFITVEPQENDVLVSIKDTGIGITPDQMNHIFEMFTQADQSLEKSRGGLGIGLALVKRLVEMHGGSVEAHSDGLGKGSEFRVRLPVVIEATRPEQTGEVDQPLPKFLRRILIVDDNHDAADSLGMLLQITGNDICIAYDGEQAVDVAEKFRPDVALLDIGLPKLNGYEVCRHIRQQPWGKNLVLIAMTGWGQTEDRRCSDEAGFDHHLVKPADPQALMKLIVEVEKGKLGRSEFAAGHQAVDS